MQKIIISTNGTSILTNGLEQKDRALLNSNSNLKEKELSVEVKLQIDKIIKEKEDNLKDLDFQGLKKISAELNGILSYYEKPESINRNDLHYILSTDTYLGEKSAYLVEKGLKIFNINNVTVKPVSELNTLSTENFRNGITNIIRWFSDEIKPMQKSYKIIFNLTGGFKSINGYLQILGMIEADETIYLFESNKDLIKIPKLPIKFDYITVLENNLNKFRLMANNFEIDDWKGIPETLLFIVDKKALLSPLGEIVWQANKEYLYKSKLFESLFPKIVEFSDKFINSIKNLSGERIKILNEQIDYLLFHLKTNEKKYNLKSLNFKKLVGKPVKNCTHEFYAWSDQDAKRCFGFFDKNNRFVIEFFDNHL